MINQIFKKHVRRYFEESGIQFNGSNPWDIAVRDSRFFRHVALFGSLGLGESYMKGWWECDRIDQCIARMMRSGLTKRAKSGFLYILRRLLPRIRTLHADRYHYDIGDDVFTHMLDRRMIYSSGYWRNARTLAEAQEAKLDMVCKKLQLKPGMRVLDIGCGWGGSLRFAAENYGVEGIGVTVSNHQYQYAKECCKDLPIEIKLQDYRKIKGRFDRIFSIGMFEHVGLRNYRSYFTTVKRCLKEDGLFLLHTIGNKHTSKNQDAWLRAYIFPDAFIPSVTQIASNVNGLFVLEDWHNFSSDYDKTLMAWHRNFEKHWDSLRHKYEESFRRMWRYYLLCCAGAFRARYTQVWQVVFSPEGVVGGYRSCR